MSTFRHPATRFQRLYATFYTNRQTQTALSMIYDDGCGFPDILDILSVWNAANHAPALNDFESRTHRSIHPKINLLDKSNPYNLVETYAELMALSDDCCRSMTSKETADIDRLADYIAGIYLETTEEFDAVDLTEGGIDQ